MPAVQAPPSELDRRGYEDFAALLRGEFSEGALALENGESALPPKPQVVWDVQTGHRRRRPAPEPEAPPPAAPPPEEAPPGRPPWEDPEVGPPGWRPRKQSDLLRSTAPGEFAAHRLSPKKMRGKSARRGAEIMAAVENSSGQQQALIDGILEQCDKVSRMILLATANALREANSTLRQPQPWFTVRAGIKKELTHMAGAEEFNRVVDMAKIDNPDDDSILLKFSPEERQEKDRMEAFFKSSVKVVKRNVNSHDFDMSRVQRRLKMHGKDADSVLLHTTNGLDPEYFGRAVNSLLKNSAIAAGAALEGYETGQHKLFSSYAQNLQDTRVAYESMAPIILDVEKFPDLAEAAQAAPILISPLEEKDLKQSLEQQKKAKEKMVWELRAQLDGLTLQKKKMEEAEERQPAKNAGGAKVSAQGAARLSEAESLDELAGIVEELRFEREKVKEQLKGGGPQIERMVEFMHNGSENLAHSMDEILKIKKKSEKVSRSLHDIALNEGRHLIWDMIRSKEIAVELLDASVLPIVEEVEEAPPAPAIIQPLEDGATESQNVSEMIQESHNVTNAQLVAAARRRQNLRQDKEALEQELAEKQAEAEAQAAAEEEAAAVEAARMSPARAPSSSSSASSVNELIDPGLLKQLRSLATAGNLVIADIRTEQKENEIVPSDASAALMDHAKERFQKMAKVSKKDAAESDEALIYILTELTEQFAEMQIQFGAVSAAGEEGARSLRRTLSKRLTLSAQDMDDSDLQLKQDELRELQELNAQRERRLTRLKEATAKERDEALKLQSQGDEMTGQSSKAGLRLFLQRMQSNPGGEDVGKGLSQESWFDAGTEVSFGSEFNSEPENVEELGPEDEGHSGTGDANSGTASVGPGTPMPAQSSPALGRVETTRSGSASSATDEEDPEEVQAREEARQQKVKELRDAREQHAKLQDDIAAVKQEIEGLMAGRKSPAPSSEPLKSALALERKVSNTPSATDSGKASPRPRLATSDLETDLLEDFEPEPSPVKTPSKGKLATLIRAHSEQLLRTRSDADGMPIGQNHKAATISLFGAIGSHKSLSQQKHKLTQTVKQVKTEVQKKKKLLMAMIPKDNLQDLINAGVFQASDVGGMGAKPVQQEVKQDDEVTRLKDKLDVLKKSVEFWQKRLENHVQKYHASVTDALHASTTAEEAARAAQGAPAAAAAATALAGGAEKRGEEGPTSFGFAAPRRDSFQAFQTSETSHDPPPVAEGPPPSPTAALGFGQTPPAVSAHAREQLQRMKTGRISGMAVQPNKLGRDGRPSLRHEARSTLRGPGSAAALSLAGHGGAPAEAGPLSPTSLQGPASGALTLPHAAELDMHKIEEEVEKSNSMTPKKSQSVKTRVQAYLATKRMTALMGKIKGKKSEDEHEGEAQPTEDEQMLPGRQRPESLDDFGEEDSESESSSDGSEDTSIGSPASSTSPDARQRLTKALKTVKVTAKMRMVAAQTREEARKIEQELAEQRVQQAAAKTPRLSAGEYAMNLVKAAGLDWEEAQRLVDMIALIPNEFMPIVYQYLLDVLQMPLVEQRLALKALSLGHVEAGSPLRNSGDGSKSLGVASLLATQLLAMKTQAGLWDEKKDSEESELVTALEADKEEDETEERPPDDEEDGKRLLTYYKMKSRLSVKHGAKKRKANRTKRSMHRSVVRTIKERQEDMNTPPEDDTPQSTNPDERPALPMAPPVEVDPVEAFQDGVAEGEMSSNFARRSSSLRYLKVWRQDSMGPDGTKRRADFRRRSSQLHIDWDSGFWREMAERVRDHKTEKYEEAQERRREEWKRLGLEAESSSDGSSPRRQAEVLGRAKFTFGGLEQRQEGNSSNAENDDDEALKVKRAKTVMDVPDEQAVSMRRAFLLGDLGQDMTPTARPRQPNMQLPRKAARASTWKGNVSLSVPNSPAAKRGSAVAVAFAGGGPEIAPSKSLPPAFLDRALKPRATLHAPSAMRRRSPSPTSGFVKLEGGKIQFTGLDQEAATPTQQQQHLFGMMRGKSKDLALRARRSKSPEDQGPTRKYDFRRASGLFWRSKTQHLRKQEVKSLYERSLTRQIVERARPARFKRKKRRLREEGVPEYMPTARRMSRRESAPKISLAAAIQSTQPPSPREDTQKDLHIGRDVQVIRPRPREEEEMRRPPPLSARLPVQRQLVLQATMRRRSLSPSKEPLPEPPKLAVPPPGWAKRGPPQRTAVGTEIAFPVAKPEETVKPPKLEKGTSNPEARLPPREPKPKPQEELPAAVPGAATVEPPKAALLPPKKMAQIPLMEAQERLKANLMLFQRRGRSPERTEPAPPPPSLTKSAKPPAMTLPGEIERLWPTQGLKPIVPQVSSLNKGGGAPVAFLQGLLAPGPGTTAFASPRKEPMPPGASDISAKATEMLRYLQSFERAPLERLLAQPRRASAELAARTGQEKPAEEEAAAKKEDVHLPPIAKGAGEKPGSRGLSAQAASWADFLEQRLGRHVRAASKSTPSPPRSVRGRELRSLLLD